MDQSQVHSEPYDHVALCTRVTIDSRKDRKYAIKGTVAGVTLMSRTNLRFTADMHTVLNAYTARTGSNSQIRSRGELLRLGLETFDDFQKVGRVDEFSSAISKVRVGYNLIHADNSEAAAGVDTSDVDQTIFLAFKGKFALPKNTTAFRYSIAIGMGKQQLVRFSDLPDVSEDLADLLREIRSDLGG